MHKRRIWITTGCCLFAVALMAWAQSAQKAGLWEITTTMNMSGMQMPQMPANAQMPQNIQVPPGVQLPPGMQMPQMPPGGGASPFGAHTTQICVTQEMIDKYGGPTAAPPSRNADCMLTNISIKAKGMTATMVCTGDLNATGDYEATFTDANTTTSTVHLKGTMKHGSNSMPIDMTMQSNSVYKGADCGSVRPIPLPKN
ncbi:MAG: DUF3617 domain-containing protein [Terracidiphilus sp.]